MHLTDFIVTTITHFIASTGYISLIILMALESMVAPIPSEAVMPFAGFLISSGQFTFLKVIVVSSIGSLIGSLLSYAIGAYGGRPLVERFGKYLFLNKHHLDVTEKFFDTRGEATIFWSRLIPVVRHFISIPAGVGRMPLPKFILYTLVGATIWNTILTYIGWQLREHWDAIGKYLKFGDVLVIALVIAGIMYWGWEKWQKRKGKT